MNETLEKLPSIRSMLKLIIILVLALVVVKIVLGIVAALLPLLIVAGLIYGGVWLWKRLQNDGVKA